MFLFCVIWFYKPYRFFSLYYYFFLPQKVTDFFLLVNQFFCWILVHWVSLRFEGWRDGSVINNTDCYSREPGLNSQHLHSCSQPYVTPVLRDLTPSSGFLGNGTWASMQAKHPHIKNKIKRWIFELFFRQFSHVGFFRISYLSMILLWLYHISLMCYDGWNLVLMLYHLKMPYLIYFIDTLSRKTFPHINPLTDFE